MAGRENCECVPDCQLMQRRCGFIRLRRDYIASTSEREMQRRREEREELNLALFVVSAEYEAMFICSEFSARKRECVILGASFVNVFMQAEK